MELTKIKWILATVILLLVSNISSAQQKPQEKLGNVSFPTSCDPKVQTRRSIVRWRCCTRFGFNKAKRPSVRC